MNTQILIEAVVLTAVLQLVVFGINSIFIRLRNHDE